MPSARIQSPADLKKLSIHELQTLAEDLRQSILTTCLANGGHLGASLGAVELALALHYVFNSPAEPLIWDVGHQAYAHKLLTGRWNRFHTLRKTGGLSGFLAREESEHDVFGAGHSSTSISVALALAVAARTKSPNPDWTVAIIGDGGLTAGVALEALNNLRSAQAGPLLIVVNDNQMSISQNIGAIPAILSGGKAKTFFELFGADYIGPIDGHDLNQLIGTLAGLKSSYAGRPIVLHALTQKGKGYAPAEEHPQAFHGVGPLSAKVTSPTDSKQVAGQSFSEAFGSALIREAQSDGRVVAVTAAMPEGTGLSEFAQKFPQRCFDVGIAEPHAVTFAAGLAAGGLKPVVAIYSTFLQRGLDAMIHDVALQKLPVVFAIDRAGWVGADGPTHHGSFDLSYLGMIPGMRIYAPACLEDVGAALKEALSHSGPSAIRYPRGNGIPRLDAAQPLRAIAPASKGAQSLLVALGAQAARAKKVAQALAVQKQTQVGVYVCSQVKPAPEELLELLRQNPNAKWVFLEDGSLRGGFASSVLFECAQAGIQISSDVHCLGHPDTFLPHGSIGDIEAMAGISDQQILSFLVESP